MTLLEIRYPNKDSRWLRLLSIELMDGQRGLPRHPTTVPGRIVFDMPAGATSLVLRVKLPQPTGALPYLLHFEEHLSVSAAAPVISFANTQGRFAGSNNPRVIKLVNASVGGVAVATIHLDLRFLDITADFDTMFATQHATATVDQCTVRVLQHTAPDDAMWLAAIPPAVGPSLRKVGALLLFTPEGDRAVDPLDQDPLGNVLRSPSTQWLFFVHPAQNPPPQGPITFWQTFDAPLRRVALQLHQSTKPVLLFLPLNNGPGLADSVRQGPSLMDSAARALWSGGSIGSSVSSGLRVTRKGLAGFGGAAANTLACWRDGRPTLSELYLFDTFGFNSYLDELAAWSQGKKLRLVGGALLQKMLDAAGRLGVPAAQSPVNLAPPFSDATIWPADSAFWQSSAVYREAYKRNSYEELSPLAANPWNDLSRGTHVFLDSVNAGGNAAGTTVIAMLQTGPSHVGLIDPASHDETAHLVNRFIGSIRSSMLNQVNARPVLLPPVPMDTLDQYKRLLLDLERWPQGLRSGRQLSPVAFLRHQWTMCGGQAPNDTFADFKGYFQLCLESSGY